MRIHTRTVWQFDPELDDYVKVEDEFYEYEGAVAEAKGGGGSTTTNTVSEPPAWQIPYIQNVLSEAERLYTHGTPQYYPGSTVANINPTQQTAWNTALNYSAPFAGQTANAGQSAMQLAMRSADPLQNPYFAPTVAASIRPATQALTEQVLPQIDDTFIGAGQFGGSRQGVAQGLAIDRYQQNVLDTVARMGSEAYGMGLDSLGRAMVAAPSIQQMGMMPAQIQGQVGDAQRAYQQQLIDASLDRWNYQQQAPYESLGYYAGLVGNPLGGTTTSVGPNNSPSRVQSVLGGAMTGASLGAAIPGLGAGAGTLLGPAGWAGMALGGLMGLF